MIKMIFYTLLTYYPDIDRVNVVLTSLILYLMVYIGVPEEQEELKMPILAAFVAADVIMLYHEYSIKWLRRQFKIVKRKARKNFAHIKSWFNLIIASITAFITEDKQRQKQMKKKARVHKHKNHSHEKKKSKTKKSVRFSPVNQYHEYQPMPLAPVASLAPLQSWEMTPRQRLEQQLLTKKYQEQLAAAATPMIDNRHLASETDAENYLKSYDETDDSDQSSDLSNSEDGFDF